MVETFLVEADVAILFGLFRSCNSRSLRSFRPSSCNMRSMSLYFRALYITSMKNRNC